MKSADSRFFRRTALKNAPLSSSVMGLLTAPLLAAFLSAGGLWLPAAAQADDGSDAIPASPDDLVFQSLEFSPPNGADYRHVIAGDIPVFVVEDRSLPLIRLAVSARAGAYLDPVEQTGLATLAAEVLRSGGTESLSPEAFDEQVDFYAADLDVNADLEQTSATLSCITPVWEECLDLFFDMMRNPRFDADRLQVAKDRALESLKRRNDNPADIETRNWGWLLYGEDFYATTRSTGPELSSIQQADLVSFHRRWWTPANLSFAVAGDVDTREILASLEKHLEGWERGEEAPWPPPTPEASAEPGLYVVQKEIPQGRVYLGHRALQWSAEWDNADAPALRVMNHILGAGGFTSRLLKRIRSDEGLAYSAGSLYLMNPYYEGQFFAYFQSKSDTVALATKIALEEIRRIQSEPVSDAELQLAKSALVESFPQTFQSTSQVAATLLSDEISGRPNSYWELFRQRIEAVTVADVQRVAQTHLHSDDMILVMVGDWPVIAAGDADGRATMESVYPGEPTLLPLRDPVTLEPVETGAEEVASAEASESDA
ncbi:MAG: pitrilysin family protein [Acidobacteriota bacterium]